MAVLSANTNPYRVLYINLAATTDIPDLLTAMRGIGYNTELQDRHVPAAGEVPAHDETKFLISNNGANQITTTFGRYLVWDNNWLYDMDKAAFTAKYTPA